MRKQSRDQRCKKWDKAASVLLPLLPPETALEVVRRLINIDYAIAFEPYFSQWCHDNAGYVVAWEKRRREEEKRHAS